MCVQPYSGTLNGAGCALEVPISAGPADPEAQRRVCNGVSGSNDLEEQRPRARRSQQPVACQRVKGQVYGRRTQQTTFRTCAAGVKPENVECRLLDVLAAAFSQHGADEAIVNRRPEHFWLWFAKRRSVVGLRAGNRRLSALPR